MTTVENDTKGAFARGLLHRDTLRGASAGGLIRRDALLGHDHAERVERKDGKSYLTVLDTWPVTTGSLRLKQGFIGPCGVWATQVEKFKPGGKFLWWTYDFKWKRVYGPTTYTKCVNWVANTYVHR